MVRDSKLCFLRGGGKEKKRKERKGKEKKRKEKKRRRGKGGMRKRKIMSKTIP